MFFDGIGIGFEKIWSRKKYRYQFRKILVSKKVSVSVSKFFGIDKSIGFGFGKNLVSKKIGIGKKFRIRFRSDFGFRHTLFFIHTSMRGPATSQLKKMIKRLYQCYKDK